MKKIFLVFVVGLGLVACGDNSSDNNMNGTGGTIDSNVTAQPDNSTITQPDTTAMDTNNGAQGSDTGTLRSMNGGNSANGAGGGNSSGQSSSSSGATQSGSGSTQGSGQSTNSANSGSSTDDTRGSK